MAWTRRHLLRYGAVGLGAATAGCDQVQETGAGGATLDFQNWVTWRVQRLLLPVDRLAPEFPKSAISANFRANGTVDPPDPDYKASAQQKFENWRLQVTGLVDHPLSLTLADIRALPQRTQITRHDCVEGWSCIGQWTGAPLFHVLDRAGVRPQARFMVCYCADSMDANSIVSTNAADSSADTDASDKATDGQDASDKDASDKDSANSDGANSDDANSDDAMPDTHYYTSLDLVDARHPQTILAYEMNGAALDVPHGAPLRLRVERQLGYKMPKYLRRLDFVEDFSQLRGGRGGYWEDLGYDWFAGI